CIAVIELPSLPSYGRGRVDAGPMLPLQHYKGEIQSSIHTRCGYGCSRVSRVTRDNGNETRSPIQYESNLSVGLTLQIEYLTLVQEVRELLDDLLLVHCIAVS